MISIAICTHNRVEQLEDLLVSLLALRSSDFEEILVIANCCTDETHEKVSDFQSQLPIRLILEDKLGLSNARNRALKEFSGTSIWFLDDDTLVDQKALSAYSLALNNYQQYTYFGGPISVDWRDKKPNWLRSDDVSLLRGLFGVFDLGETDVRFRKEMLGPYGANFLLRRELIDALGDFDVNLGVRGNIAGRGEESDYFSRAMDQGFDGMYLAEARIRHCFQSERINLGYLWRYGVQKGRAEVNLRNDTSRRWIGTAGYQLLAGIWQLLKGRRDYFYQCWINMGIARGRVLSTKEKYSAL